MKREHLWYLVAVVAAILLFSSSAGLFEEDQSGRRAADFTLQSTSGETVGLSDLKGKTVVVNFMATWCPSCREEIPELAQLDQEYGDDVVILSISNEDPATLQEFKENRGAGWTFLVDQQGRVFQEYGVSAIPNNFVVNPEGDIVYHRVGKVSAEELRGAIEGAR